MGRASLRCIGLSDEYISTLSSKQARTELLCRQVLDELQLERQREQQWLQQAVGNAQRVSVTTLVEDENGRS